MTPRDWTPEYLRYLAATDVIGDLERIPGVRRVSIGGRLRRGILQPEMCFQVFVNAKRPTSGLWPQEIIPRTLAGFATDVVAEPLKLVELRGPNGQDDRENYPIKVGGIRIQESRNRGEATLGCFARRNSDNKPVALTNFHLFFPNEADQPITDVTFQTIVDLLRIKVGQPKFTKKSCCTCNVIGELVKVSKRPIDAAIVLLDSGVRFLDKVKRIPTPYDGGPPLSGVITGVGTPVALNEVWKVGSVTGLTRGKIQTARPGEDIVVQFDSSVDNFAEHGDSGSVLVDTITSKVVGLVKKGGDWSKGIVDTAAATPIQMVLSGLDIRIDGDPTQANATVAEEIDELFTLPAQSPFAAVEERIRASHLAPLVRELVTTHADELVELVNESRSGMVAWHRAQGPAYFAALARSSKERAYRIPEAIGGITRAEAATRLRGLFDAQGSEALRTLLQRHGDELQQLLVRHDTLIEMLDAYDRQMRAATEGARPS